MRILGMNARNLLFVRPYNTGRSVKLARNKLATKRRLLKFNLPTAKLYGSISSRRELFSFDWSTLPNGFALKPNSGLGGNGIVIIYGKNKQGDWIGSGEKTYTTKQLITHVSNILDGNFSISNVPDTAYFEERLTLCEEFKAISYKGIPDIRVIIFNSVPVMAELRLPTKQSEGKANLAIGGVGVGVDLTTGTTTFAHAKHLGEITLHPDYQTALSGIKIPHWNEVLRIAIEAQRAVGLGFGGIDIVLDKKLGPVVLEVNGHPGLEIQNVNHASLRDRLERVKDLSITSTAKGLAISKELFGTHDLPERATPILGVFETVQVFTAANEPQIVRAILDTSLASTTLTKDFAIKLGFQSALTALATVAIPSTIQAADAQQAEAGFREIIKGLHKDLVDIVAVRIDNRYVIRPKIPLTFKLGQQLITTEAAIALDNKLSHPLVIGRKNLTGFLINPGKTK
ncbi:MAG: sugar-transfer associated ATP-grasp domain-containing protein [Patescibacteria group bacterium]|jgi:alpha-L-glutamate ligase-like protein